MNYNNIEIRFIKINGAYTLHPVSFVGLWNESQDLQEMQKIARNAWADYTTNNTLVPNAAGKIANAPLSVEIFKRRAQSYRSKRNIFLKEHPHERQTAFDWDNLARYSKKWQK